MSLRIVGMAALIAFVAAVGCSGSPSSSKPASTGTGGSPKGTGMADVESIQAPPPK